MSDATFEAKNHQLKFKILTLIMYPEYSMFPKFILIFDLLKGEKSISSSKIKIRSGLAFDEIKVWIFSRCDVDRGSQSAAKF